MKIVHVGPIDAAGVGWNLSEAVNEFTPHESWAIFTHPFVGAHGKSLERAESLLRTADVVVHHVGYEQELVHALVGECCTKDRTIAFFNGSTWLRQHLDEYRKRYEGWVRAATNTDIASDLDCEFVPAPTLRALDRGELMHKMPPIDERLVVMQTYTDPSVKNTTEVSKAAGKFPNKWVLRLKNGMKHHKCLEARNEAHVLFDHMQGYYGVCSVEAAAAGMPCINGLDDLCLGYLAQWGVDHPPWLHACDVDELIGLLGMVANDPWPLFTNAREMRVWYEKNFNNRIKAHRFTQWLETT